MKMYVSWVVSAGPQQQMMIDFDKKQHRGIGVKSLSRESVSNVLAKNETGFLEKFFRYNLLDFYGQQLRPLQEHSSFKDVSNATAKQLLECSFLAKSDISVDDWVETVGDFYRRSVTPDIEHCFRRVYSSGLAEVEEGELVVLRVRLKVEVQQIQQMPDRFIEEIEECSRVVKEEAQVLSGYGRKSINLFLVYFGDTAFHTMQKQAYEDRSVNLFGKEVRVKIHLFYVSRMALFNTFKRLNKLNEVEYISDLLIQLYHFKRDRVRLRRLRKNARTRREGLWKVLRWVAVLTGSMALLKLLLQLFP